MNNHSNTASLGQDCLRQPKGTVTILTLVSSLCHVRQSLPQSISRWRCVTSSVSGSPLSPAHCPPGLPSSSLAHIAGLTYSWAREAGAGIFGQGVVLGCHSWALQRPMPAICPPRARPLGARVLHILSPFLSLSRGQWQPEESEDYVSKRCASACKTWVRLGSWDTPPPPPLLPA